MNELNNSIELENYNENIHCSIYDTIGDDGWTILLIQFVKDKTIPYLNSVSDSPIIIRFNKQYKEEELKELTKSQIENIEYKEIKSKYHGYIHEYQLTIKQN